jgi:septal ring factor EnvC (AmiA/AmiB activator)
MEGRPAQPRPPGGPQQPPRPGEQAPQRPAPGRQAIDTAPDQRIEGLRSGLAQLDRKLAVRTYVGAALVVVALAAGAAAITLSLGTREDAATEADIQDLREELTGVEQTAEQAAQRDVQAVSESLAEIENQLRKVRDEQGSLRDELSVAQDDIQDVRNQISELRSGGSGTPGQ